MCVCVLSTLVGKRLASVRLNKRNMGTAAIYRVLALCSCLVFTVDGLVVVTLVQRLSHKGC